MRKKSQPYDVFKKASNDLIEILRHGKADFMPFVELFNECLSNVYPLKVSEKIIRAEFQRICAHAFKFRSIKFLEYMINNNSFHEIAFYNLCKSKSLVKDDEFILLFNLINKKFNESSYFKGLCTVNCHYVLKKYSWKVFCFFYKKANIDLNKVLLQTCYNSFKVNLIGVFVINSWSIQKMLHLIHAGVNVQFLSRPILFFISKYFYMERALLKSNTNYAIALYMSGLRFEKEHNNMGLRKKELLTYSQVENESKLLMILYCFGRKRIMSLF